MGAFDGYRTPAGIIPKYWRLAEREEEKEKPEKGYWLSWKSTSSGYEWCNTGEHFNTAKEARREIRKRTKKGLLTFPCEKLLKLDQLIK